MTTMTIEQIFNMFDCGKKKGYITRSEAKNAKSMLGGIFVVKKGMDFDKFKAENLDIYNKFAGTGSALNCKEVTCALPQMLKNDEKIAFRIPTDPTWQGFVDKNESILLKLMKENGIERFPTSELVHALKLAVSLAKNGGNFNEESYKEELFAINPGFPLEMSKEMLIKAFKIIKSSQSAGSSINAKEALPSNK